MTADPAMSYPSYVNPQVLNMFNVSTLLNQKDSRWLQLEVCREFQRQKCTRSDAECKFAHPPPNVEVQNGRVTACYDSIKVGCPFLLSSSPLQCPIQLPDEPPVIWAAALDI